MLKQNVKDYYYHKAKQEGFSARSVYKLQQIQKKYGVLRPGSRVLDLGAAPGSWSEYVAIEIGEKGELVSLDERPLSDRAMAKIRQSKCRFSFVVGSVFDELEAGYGPFEVVLSDLAPWTGGNKFLDSHRSLELVSRSFELACNKLKEGGNFVVKLFQSQESMELTKNWKNQFQTSKLFKPPSTHKESREIYFVGCGRRA